MSVHRQDRLKLKAKSRNVNTTLSKQRLTVQKSSENHDESASATKKMRTSETVSSATHSKSHEHGADSDDVVMISDDEEMYERETRKLKSKAKTICSVSKDVSSIDSFRKQLLQIRPTVSTNLEDLPAFNNSSTDSPGEITVDDFIYVVGGELSPLPQMCSWCRRRKPIDLDNYSADHINNLKIDTGSSVQSKTEIKSQKKLSQHVSDKNNFLDEEQTELFKIESKNVLPNSKQLNSDSNVKPSGSKFVVEEHSSTRSETIRRETTSIDSKTLPVEERGDNLFLRLSNKPTGFPPGKSRSQNSHVDFKRAENLSKVSNNATRSIVDNSRKKTNEPVNREKEEKLASCPLCQLEFDKRLSQLDIDGHIAACLDSAEDDIMW